MDSLDSMKPKSRKVEKLSDSPTCLWKIFITKSSSSLDDSYAIAFFDKSKRRNRTTET
jgi:hypothetical protein